MSNSTKSIQVEVLENCPFKFAVFLSENLKYPDKDENIIYNWNFYKEFIDSNFYKNFCSDKKILITTYLSKDKKPTGTRQSPDIENLLLYNLCHRAKKKIMDYLNIADKIFIQCLDNFGNKWPQPNYPHYYFYGVFDNITYSNYLFYNCHWKNCCKCYTLSVNDFNKLKSSHKNEKSQRLNNIAQRYQKSTNPIKNTKYCLYIKTPGNLCNNIDDMKNLIDIIIVFANKLNIIEHPNPNNIVNRNGWNPTDDLLYFCEIEKVNNNNNNIEFCICPIIQDGNCCSINLDNLKNYSGFKTVEFTDDEKKKYIEEFCKSVNENNKDNSNTKTNKKRPNINPKEKSKKCYDYIIEAIKELGGKATIKQVENYIKSRYGNICRDIGTLMADMVSLKEGGNSTSSVPNEKRILKRVNKGEYQIIK